MVQLNRSMMERYEIAGHRPESTGAVIFGAGQIMLGAVARLLDKAGVGALCVTPAARALNEQDGMFTLLVRGEEDGKDVRREEVVQSILRALDPEEEFTALVDFAGDAALEYVFLGMHADPLELALAARFLYARFQTGQAMPLVIAAGSHPLQAGAVEMRAAMLRLCCGWGDLSAFEAWLRAENFRCLLCDGLSGRLSEAECAKARHDMNYRDDFIAWAEPLLRCTLQGPAPEALMPALSGQDYDEACLKKARVFDAVTFLCASAGYLSGMDSFAQVLRDEKLRAWIGSAFFEEILPALPFDRDAIAPDVISAFTRLENSSNDVPLMETAGLMGNLPQTVLPAIRAWSQREFEAPPRLSLALSAAIMIYAGARENGQGRYEIQRGDKAHLLRDDREILAAFSRLSHDMPAESLAYAALADRDIWGADLREIDGLEMRVAFNLSSIQRIGFRETLRIQSEQA